MWCIHGRHYEHARYCFSLLPIQDTHMPYYECAPHPLLAPYVHSLCYSERTFAPPAVNFTLFPDTLIELVYSFGAPCTVAYEECLFPLPACYVVGLLDEPLTIHAHGVVMALRVRLFPWGAYPLLGTLLAPVATGIRGIACPSEALARSARDIAASWSKGSDHTIALLQDVLLAQALAYTCDETIVATAAKQILDTNGNIAIDDLAHATGISPRALRRRFHGLFGKGPKTLARTARFEYVQQRLWETPDHPLSDVALAAGYADQAHMQREFRQFSGRTPSQFANEQRTMRALLDSTYQQRET